MSSSLGFTIQTIALSSLGLKCIVLNQNFDNIEQEVEKLKTFTHKLTNKSAHFEEYIRFIGGIEQMMIDIEKQDINAVARWMPFAYA